MNDGTSPKQDTENKPAQSGSVSLPPPESAIHQAIEPPQQANQTSSSTETDVIGIISIIMPFAGFAPIGVVLGIIGINRAKQGGYPSTLSKVGLIISSIFMLIFLVVIVLIFGSLAFLASSL